MEVVAYYDEKTEQTVSPSKLKFYPDAKPVYRNIPFYDHALQTCLSTGLERHEDGYRIVWKLQNVPEPLYSEELTRRAQKKCQQLLLECDWTIGNDSPLTKECQAEWKVYRKHLRDINKQEGFPKVIDWGVEPEKVKEAA